MSHHLLKKMKNRKNSSSLMLFLMPKGIKSLHRILNYFQLKKKKKYNHQGKRMLSPLILLQSSIKSLK